MARKILALTLPLLAALAIACSGDDAPSPTATPTSAIPNTPVVTPPPATSAPATATRPAGTVPAGTATPRPTLPPVEGTVDPLGFGSTDPFTIKSNPDPITGAALLTAVRAGAHPEQGGWDRIVFEFAGVRPPGEVRYVDSASQCGSGAPVSIPGAGAILQVGFTAANAHTEAGQPTTVRQIDGPGGIIVQAVQNCDFEAHVDWAIGLKSKQRFKVTLLENPTRVVVDIKW